jgi:diguanylate cyclase (GGDEF)-like protein/PAS domain S-box-containing protein
MFDDQTASFSGPLAQGGDFHASRASREAEEALRAEIAERERVLRQSRETMVDLEEAQRLGQIGSWQWRPEDDVARISRQMAKILGLDPDLPPPKHRAYLDLYVPESAERLSGAIAQVMAGGEPYCVELQLKGEDGDQGQGPWVEARGAAVLDAQGRVVALRGTLQDITARRQADEALRRSQRLLNRTGQLAGVGGWEVDLRTNEVIWSDQTCRMHGVEPGYRPTREDLKSFSVPGSWPEVQAAVSAAIASGTGFDLEMQIVRRDGALRWLRMVGSVERVDGQPARLEGAFQDITEHRRISLALAEQHELLQVTLQSIGDAVITTDALGKVTWLNPVAERMTGWRTAEALGRELAQVFNVVHDETRKPIENPLGTRLAEGKLVGLASHTLLISRDGPEFGIEDSAAPIRNAAGEMLGVVLVFRDVSEQRRMAGEMNFRATHDALTGLVNRTEFEARLLRLLRKAQEDASEHALLYIDLDQFKLVNDACGHAVGDQLLQRVGKLLGDAIRSRDTLARLGGDEFAIILERCNTTHAQRVAQKICDLMDDFRFVHEDRRFRIGASIGMVPVDKRWANPAAILQAADTSCYAAKEAGRNRVHTWFDTDAAMHARHYEMQWTTRVEHALDDDGFVLFAQRIEPLKPGAGGLHAEVLLRMKNPDGSHVMPGAFLPAAERFHLASRVDRWVLTRALAWMKSLAEPERLGLLSVNLSGQSVGDRAFHAWAHQTLAQAGPRVCAMLCLEVTETAAVTHLADAAAFIEAVRRAGVKVALDDFGAGASSFGYLKSLPVDFLKIDGQFIRDLVTDPLDDAAVRCFADVARVVGVRTVAEFVDSAAVLERLREIGVDYAQGYLLHRPEPIDQLMLPLASPALG